MQQVARCAVAGVASRPLVAIAAERHARPGAGWRVAASWGR